MKTLVTYFTETGNTKKVAEAIFGEIGGEKEIKDMGGVASLEGYDLIFVGFPVQAFAPPRPVKQFLQDKCKGKKVVLFMTHAQREDFDELAGWLETCRKAAEGAEIVGEFSCQGEIQQPILDAMSSNEDPYMQKLASGAATSKGQPDEARLERARSFAREIMAKYGN